MVTSTMAGMQRVHLIISGFVQGVGFRKWVRRQAHVLHLSGWVKNRQDGAVEILAEGNKELLTRFITLCRTGPEISYVEQCDETWSDATEEFTSFEVIY